MALAQPVAGFVVDDQVLDIVAGTRHILPDGTWLFRPGRITVTIGVPMEPNGRGWPEMIRLRDAAVDDLTRGCGESAFASQTTGSRG